ncbi:cytochrome b/b6 domain-containing protein [Roseospirillum parvum]|uniref:Cytochrome b561 n=1 Tax=Roseospirillum parvum TaxID=83401 RepID=A0A1G8AJ59_9PROT|nr:cytochrome b/b6 domain-containing protein [Roseospirillum parvum]SDH20873.1 cytochrome b561 [Roseospirillum parvum]
MASLDFLASPARRAQAGMRLWHATIAGGFLVAWLSGDSDDFYMVHQVAGYTVLIAVVLRLLVGLLARRAPWRLPRPDPAAARRWLAEKKGRNPLFAWLAVSLLLSVAASAGLGMAAHWLPAVEDPHALASDVALWVVVAHGLAIPFLYGAHRRLARRLAGTP